MATRTLTFDITTADAQTIGKLRGIQRELGKTGDAAERVTKRGITTGEVLGGLAVGAGVRAAIGEFEEAEVSARATEAVIRSTGNAAEVSAEQQAELVTQLSRLAGIDDEVVNGGANMLRTFTQIKGEKFGEALGASLDYAAFKGKDLASSAELIGKALNDPLTGMNKLTRAGVVFSAQQKQQIKDFMAVGDVASAQGVILQELETEYGGQAEAAATASGKMKVAFGDAAEAAGGVLAPGLTAAAGAAGFASDQFQRMPPYLQASGLGLAAVAVVAKKVEDRVDAAGGSLRDLGGDLSVVDKGLIGAAAGLAAYGTTLGALEAQTQSGVDASLLAKDLEDLSTGAISANEATDQLGGSIDSLAEKFQRVDNDKLSSRLTSTITTTIETKGAANDLKVLDEQLAALAAKDPGAAASAVVSLTKALAAMGIEQETVLGQLPKYGEELQRAQRHTKDDTEATNDNAAAKKKAAEDTSAWITAVDKEADKVRDLHDSQMDLVKAGEDVTKAEQDLATARQEAAGNSDEYRQAQDAIVEAEARVADAAENTQRAQEALTAAREDARETLDDLSRSAEGAALSEKRAENALEDARKNQAKVNRDHRSTARDREDAALTVAEAELALRDARDRNQDTAKELADAEKAGVEGAPNVVAAKEAVTAAIESQRDAEGQVAQATRDAAAVIIEAQGRVGEASKVVQDTISKHADKQREVTEKIFGTVAANDGFIAALQLQRDSLDPSNPLRQNLDAYILKLQQVQGLLSLGEQAAQPYVDQYNASGGRGSPGGQDPRSHTSTRRVSGSSDGVTIHAPNLRTVAPGKKQLDTALNRASKWQAGSQSVMTP